MAALPLNPFRDGVLISNSPHVLFATGGGRLEARER
jgi:hypothetical protein